MTNEQNNFIEKIGAAARAYYATYKILPSLMLAMAIKESGWGKSQLAAKYYNYYGMKWNTKCGTKYITLPTKEYKNGKYVTVNAKFRAYDTLEEGIEGFYKFITGYKRYSNLIGEKSPYEACKKIAADGWATAPDYGTSLYNDYILKYNLTRFDVPISAGGAPDPGEAAENSSYIKGMVYTTESDLYIRKTPGGIKKKMYELTVNAKMNSFQDPYGDAVLRAGTRVTCKDIVNVNKAIWLEIPSGYICAIGISGKIYVK